MSEKLKESVFDIYDALGYDLNDPHMAGSPERVARFMREWHTQGKEPPQLTTFEEDCDQIVVERDIPFYSMCAHHGLPFIGKAHIAYLPNGRVLGLSKFGRVVDYFARRYTVQERVTKLVADLLEDQLSPKGLAVIIEAEHLCMSMRGIRMPGHKTLTSDLRGKFRATDAARAEVLQLMKGL